LYVPTNAYTFTVYKYTALTNKSKDWLARIQNNVFSSGVECCYSELAL